MNFIIASTFVDSLARLGAQAQTLVKQAAFELQLAPAHPSFQLHRLDRAIEQNFWSARVNRDLRIILYRDADHLVLCYAAPHDDAYRWGQKRRFTIHPQTRAAQVVEIQERVEEVVKYVPRATPSLFGHYDRDYLLALGVPEEWLDAVLHTGYDQWGTPVLPPRRRTGRPAAALPTRRRRRSTGLRPRRIPPAARAGRARRR